MGENKKLIVKSNFIVEASYKLSLGEQRVIYVLASMIKPNDDEFKPYKLSVKEFAEILGTKSKDMYSQVARYVEGLRDRDLTIVKEKSILKTKWLSSAEYFIDDGYVELCFDPKLKPYLLMLKERFTKLSLEQMVSFNSQYSGRIYELLKQYFKIGERIFMLEELRNLLGLGFSEYAKYGLFKQRILSKAKEEINSNSDLFIDFEEFKKARKVTALKFYIKSKNKSIDEIAATKLDSVPKAPKELKENKYIEKVKSIMCDHEITSLEAKKIYDSSKGDFGLIEKVYKDFKTKQVGNFVGAMISMVKPGVYNAPKGNDKKIRFNDYEQREFDPTMEAGLLGWDQED